MSDYTPTTDIVRSHFSASVDEYGTRDGINLTIEEAETAFDRWHADVIRKAEAQAWEEGAAAAWFESGVLQYGDDYPRDNPSWLPFSIRKTNPYRKTGDTK